MKNIESSGTGPDTAQETRRTKSRIKTRLMRKMTRPKPDIGPALIKDMADWGIWMRGRGATAGTGDWHVQFLRWALLGRCKDFAAFCRGSGHPRAAEALAAIQKVYDFHWPHQASCGYIFHVIWGWLQLEMEKPGESKPASIQEQQEGLKKIMKERGIPILGWNYDFCGGVRAIIGKEDAPHLLQKLKQEQEDNPPRNPRELAGRRGEDFKH